MNWWRYGVGTAMQLIAFGVMVYRHRKQRRDSFGVFMFFAVGTVLMVSA